MNSQKIIRGNQIHSNLNPMKLVSDGSQTQQPNDTTQEPTLLGAATDRGGLSAVNDYGDNRGMAISDLNQLRRINVSSSRKSSSDRGLVDPIQNAIHDIRSQDISPYEQ
jgi:hypothetical protein